MAGTVRFAFDRTVGRLGKWLRLLGYDSEQLYPETESSILHAILLRRIVLTRDHSLIRNLQRSDPQSMTVFIRHDQLQAQLKQVWIKTGISLSLGPMSRCTSCNLQLQTVDASSVCGKVPEYIEKTHRHFQVCPSCRRLYWTGTHTERMSLFLQQISG